ncbi:hypothetical protein [Aquimarina sp. AU119]|uniref:hypothetical protein n=1 Tax=Aquimarina sp. AU119 TaxID=2108528 RepID=UPI000D68ED0A|nr:hypothetical protein [Aquimarina sp. AU119]
MRILLLAYFLEAFLIPNNIDEECGDGNVYVVERQTKFDKRFDSYKKIGDSPSLINGDLNKVIEDNLKLSDEAKKIVFRLNYMFTITCDGKIKDIEIIGEPKMYNWTNLIEIVKKTEGNWIPAKKEGKEVDCVYFSKKTIIGSKY